MSWMKTAAVAVMLQKRLACTGDITDWQAGDLCENGRLDVTDLCITKRELLK
ncbi:MAG: hypothetical protein IJY74_00790 [Oscillospiraceae bacterium]|nr:hypothetical protein [Oscillospiraceae bacterium]